MKLTDAEREAVISADIDDVDRSNGFVVLGPGGTNGNTPTVFEAVEQIIAARVTAALNEAADAIEAWRDVSARYADDDARMDDARSKALQRMNAYDRSARIVRERIPTDSAIAGAP